MGAMKRPPIPPGIVLFVGILAVSTASIMIRFAQREAPSLAIAAWRLSLAALVLAPFALSRRRAELTSLTHKERLLAVFSGLFLAIHFAAWISSLSFTSVASSVVLVSTAPLWVALLAPLFLKEPLPSVMLVGLLLALLGSAIVGVSDSCAWTSAGLACPGLDEFLRAKSFLGDLLALVGAFSVAGYLLIGRGLRSRLSLLSYIFVVYGVAAVALLVVALLFGLPLFGFSPTTYLWLLGLALVPQLIGHTSYNWALAYLPAAFVSIVVLGEPVGSSILAYFILDEKITILKLIGALLILVGIYLAARAGSAPAQQTPQDSVDTISQ